MAAVKKRRAAPPGVVLNRAFNETMARAAAARGGFVCLGCGSDDYSSHTYTCVAAVVAAALGTNLLEVSRLAREAGKTKRRSP